MRTVAVLLPVLVLLSPSVCSATQVPTQMTVQGKLTDSSNAPRVGSFTFTFELYGLESGGIRLWPIVAGESQTVTTDGNGLWTAQIGTVDPLSDNVFASEQRWLQITVDDGDLPPQTLPRVRISTSPYSFRISTVDGAEGGNITSKVSIGEGHANTGDYAFVAGHQNTATGLASSVSGGTKNDATNTEANVGGGAYNSASGEASTVAGGFGNLASGDLAAIGGGLNDTSSGAFSTIGGGYHNRAFSSSSTIGGGYDNSAYGDDAAIAGGYSNIVVGSHAAIGGGGDNSASGNYSCVPGGDHNIAGGDWAMATGRRAHAPHRGSFLWGDSRDEDVNSAMVDEFAIRAWNGLRMVDAHGNADVRKGTYYADNAIAAWAKVRGTDGATSGNDFGVISVVRNSAGNYTITVNVIADNAATLIPVATIEADAPPTSALTARQIYINQVDVGVFDVYITNGNHAATDNDFVFMVTAR